jgi:hypothetical protein
MSEWKTMATDWRFGPQCVRTEDRQAVDLADRCAAWDPLDWPNSPEGGLERRLIELRSELGGSIPVVEARDGSAAYTLSFNSLIRTRTTPR